VKQLFNIMMAVVKVTPYASPVEDFTFIEVIHLLAVTEWWTWYLRLL